MKIILSLSLMICVVTSTSFAEEACSDQEQTDAKAYFEGTQTSPYKEHLALCQDNLMKCFMEQMNKGKAFRTERTRVPTEKEQAACLRYRRNCVEAAVNKSPFYRKISNACLAKFFDKHLAEKYPLDKEEHKKVQEAVAAKTN